MDWDKTDIIRYLAKLWNYRSFLEICTPTTGNLFAKIDQSRFDACHRLMYRCPVDFADGLNIDFRSSGSDIEQCIAEIRRNGLHYDIILVDPWHEYETSFRDIELAFSLLIDSGAIVIHDCDPPTDDLINPQYSPGSWCGVTFIAYVDFLVQSSGLKYCTVDTDFGCGVIEKSGNSMNEAPIGPVALRRQWEAVRGDPGEAFRFMKTFRRSLLGLVRVDEFIRAEAEAMLASQPAVS
ncbi:MAG TPA: hypothetical protein VK442_04240 [Xanthobacteraceae bacterium]|nr:hypothetical protein [Xanthobacteraceae bacterium]